MFGEIQNAIAENTINLLSDLIDNHDSVSPQEQLGEITYYKRRTPADSELDPSKSIEENFADGRGPGRAGDSQRHGIPKGATMAELEKAAKAPGRKGQLARWQINMRRGKKK